MAFNGNNHDESSDLSAELDLDFEDDEDDEEGGDEGWLASYSDMMTDLMAIFVILFAFAATATAHQTVRVKAENAELKSELEAIAAANQLSIEELGEITDEMRQAQDDLDRIYELIKQKVDADGYSDSITMEKSEGFINFRFNDNVLFYPDSPVMKETSYDLLNYIGDLLSSIENSIGAIEISGHTAKVGEDSTTNFFAWELSSNRAISVLKFFIQNCDLPQSKMVTSGFAHYHPISDNDREQTRSLNRRVEVKILRIQSRQIKLIESLLKEDKSD